MTFDLANDFTVDKVIAMLPRDRSAAVWHPVLLDSLTRYQINTVNRVAAFMAQCAHESADFTVLEENLNYSASGLLRVFSKYFTADRAAQCERQPEVIANIVYANRMGNGPTESGDGYAFRGRGIMQITGRSNYTIASNDIYGSDFLIQHPWIVGSDQKPEVAVEVACWFWNRNRLNRLADDDDIDGITYRINGGWNGKEERTAYYQRNKNILA